MAARVQHIDALAFHQARCEPHTVRNVINSSRERRPFMVREREPFNPIRFEPLAEASRLALCPSGPPAGFKGEKAHPNAALNYLSQIRQDLRLHKGLAQPEIAYV
jgi:hypothetical protein